MRPLRAAVTTCALMVGAGMLASCATNGVAPPKVLPECTDSVTVIVTGVDTMPTFSWTPECKLARLIVEELGEERWGTERLDHTNSWTPPVVYGIHPPGSENVEPGRPLYYGTTYVVSVYRWLVPEDPEGFQRLSSREFTPTRPIP